MKSFIAKASDSLERRWYLVDAAGKPAGRLAVKIAEILRGRNKPTYTPHVDTGDFVVVINAERILLTGRKEDQKIYRRYSGYPGGLKEIPAGLMRRRHPTWILSHAVRGMLPHNKLSRKMFKRLKIYAGPEHPHAAQQPQEIKLL